MAIAMQALCFIPPLSSCGYIWATSADSPTDSKSPSMRSSCPPVTRARFMRPDRVCQLLADAHDRVERVHCPLRNEGDLSEARLPHLLVREFKQIHATKDGPFLR